jgi:cobalt-zinc-cadmium efflux system outer membrane protein
VLEEEVVRSRVELDAIRKELLPRAKAALAAARRGYDAGAFGYQEIAESQRTLNDLAAREVSALRALHIAHASLNRLAGRLVAAPSNQGIQP